MGVSVGGAAMSVEERIAQALREHELGVNQYSGQSTCMCGKWRRGVSAGAYEAHVAAAVRDVLEIWLPPLFASAIHAYADSELTALPGYGDDPTAADTLERLNNEAASIAAYAFTSNKWVATQSGDTR